MQRFRIILPATIALILVLLSTSCDLMEGNESENLKPVAEFVNVPVPEDTFSFAPRIYWTGHDPDGFINGFEYHDATEQEAIDAFRAGDSPLMTYINGLPADAWTATQEASEVIFLLTEEGETQEHIFVVRSIDNQGMRSDPVARPFFRTNTAPNTPRIRWSQDLVRCDTEQQGYRQFAEVCDTLYWGEAVTGTYAGVEFLWQGSDPDSRLSNVIPLEYSYVLVRMNTDGTQDTMALPVYNDSSQVIDQRAGWSDWDDATSVVLTGYETGNYEFTLRVRDDGLTEADSTAQITFYAIKPTREKYMLIVDGNKNLAGVDALFMGRDPDNIMAFYETALPEAWDIAEQLRTNPLVLQGGQEIPSLGSYDEQVDFYENRDDDPLPYALAHRYELIWYIDDDNPAVANPNDANDRMQVLMDNMDVGGHVMLSGRRVFNSLFGVNPGGTIPTMFNDYFDLVAMQSKPQVRLVDADLAEFRGVAVGNTGLLPLDLDPLVMEELRLGNNTLECLPGVEWFGRSTGRTGLDFSLTLLNYISCTADEPFEITDVDMTVVSSTQTVASLAPLDGHSRLLAVTRVYNATRDAIADVQYIDSQSNVWVSIPAASGPWENSDVLECDYRYIPISIDHDQPTGERFARMDGVTDIEVFPDGRVEVSVSGVNIFKTSLYTFPLSFLINDPMPVNWAPELGSVGPVSLLIATELLWFKQDVDFSFNQDGGS